MSSSNNHGAPSSEPHIADVWIAAWELFDGLPVSSGARDEVTRAIGDIATDRVAAAETAARASVLATALGRVGFPDAEIISPSLVVAPPTKISTRTPEETMVFDSRQSDPPFAKLLVGWRRSWFNRLNGADVVAHVRDARTSQAIRFAGSVFGLARGFDADKIEDQDRDSREGSCNIMGLTVIRGWMAGKTIGELATLIGSVPPTISNWTKQTSTYYNLEALPASAVEQAFTRSMDDERPVIVQVGPSALPKRTRTVRHKRGLGL